VTRQDRQDVATLCAERAGLRVDPEKEYLIENRLGPVARREGFGSIPDLLQAVRDRGDERLASAVVEAMSPAETAFFRDPPSVELAVAQAFTNLARRREGQALRIWVAACGSGQEIYSVAMLLDEQTPPGVTIDLCASDLSDRRLEKARSGVYSQFEVQRGLPAQRLVRHFEKRDDSFVVAQRLRQMVRWRRVNLLEDMTPLGPFDLVFCRNVLGGMLGTARTLALGNLKKVLTPDGYLVLGLGDPAGDLTTLPGQPGIYRAEAGRRAA
jgi:chemotaxis protein methyltransferase CheR